MENSQAANGLKSSYQAEFAQKGDSGLSFGEMQNDVRKNKDAEEIFRRILKREGFGNSEIDNIVDKAKKQGVTRNNFSKETLDRINRALENNKSEIDDLDVQSMNKAIDHVEKVINQVDSRGVFNESHPDFHKAAGMAMHWGNQTGNLKEFGDHSITTTICTTTADRIAAHDSLPVRDLNSNGIINAMDTAHMAGFEPIELKS